MQILRKYRKKLEKRFKKEEITRQQFNITCNIDLVLDLKLLAQSFDPPIKPLYPFVEHVLELGMAEVAVILQDKALAEMVQRHILKEHLRAAHLDPVDWRISESARRIKSALELLRLCERKAGSIEAVQL